MPRSRYSEEEAVQKPAGELLRRELGWDVVYCYDEEKLGEDGTLGRVGYEQVVLERYLAPALLELNEWLEEGDIPGVISTLKNTLATDTLLQTNEKKYEMLRDGIPVERVRPDGSTYEERALVFDFEHPEMNSFLACEELIVKSPFYTRRCDIVGFVNGIPLMFVEFKRHDKDVRRAYDTGFQRLLHDGGYAGLNWPVEYGGQGRTPGVGVPLEERALGDGNPLEVTL